MKKERANDAGATPPAKILEQTFTPPLAMAPRATPTFPSSDTRDSAPKTLNWRLSQWRLRVKTPT